MKYALSDAIRRAWDGSERPPEQGLIDWAKQFVRPGSTFVDIGSHVGSWSFEMVGHCRQVHAFEAQRETFYRLCAGIIENNLTHAVHAHHLALGHKVGNAELRIISDDGGGSSLCNLPTHQHPRTTELVAVSTLDVQTIQDASLVKIDVEGNELAVLLGAPRFLERNSWPRLIFESWLPGRFLGAEEMRKALFDHVRFLGYEIIGIANYPEMFLAEHR